MPFQAMLTNYLSLWPYHQLINSHLLLPLLMFLNLLTTDQVMYSQPKLRTCFEFSLSILSPPKMLPVISLGWKSDLELVTRLFNHILLHIENRFFEGFDIILLYSMCFLAFQISSFASDCDSFQLVLHFKHLKLKPL